MPTTEPTTTTGAVSALLDLAASERETASHYEQLRADNENAAALAGITETARRNYVRRAADATNNMRSHRAAADAFTLSARIVRRTITNHYRTA